MKTFPILPILIAVAAAAAIVGGLFIFGSGGNGAFEVSLIATSGPGDMAGEIDGECPTPSIASAQEDRRSTIGRGAIFPVSLQFNGGDGASSNTELAATASADVRRDDGIGLDVEAQLVCVELDRELSSQGVEVVGVEVVPDGRTLELTPNLVGLGSGDTALVHLWLRTTDDPDLNDNDAEVRITEASAGSGDIEVLVGQIERPLRLVSETETSVINVTLSDDAQQKEAGDSITYTADVINQSRSAVINDVTLSVELDEALTFSDLTVNDAVAPETTCSNTDSTVTCAIGFMPPGDEISVEVVALIDDNVSSAWANNDGECREGREDLCSEAVVSWRKAGGATEDAASDEPTDIDALSEIALVKSAAGNPPALYANEPVVLNLGVRNLQDQPLSDVVIDEPGCVSPVLLAGDDNNDMNLDQGEEWTYNCLVSAGTLAIEDAAVSATTPSGRVVEDAAELPLSIDDVILPDLRVFLGTDNAWRVSNVGDVELSEVHLNSPDCSASRDEPLEAEAVWTTECTGDGENDFMTAWATDPFDRPFRYQSGSAPSSDPEEEA